ncbi:MAG TPA: cation:proton antiporter [Gaiellaceae bacterium]|nr:cation:proton antiporter [Gaiellaceae bacterium]
MQPLTSFGLTVLLVAAALSAALLASKLSARASIPAAALFLAAAAIASDVFPGLTVSISTVQRVGTVALIVILFDGGSSIGLRRFRVAAMPIATLGILGTFATAGLVALFAHWAFGFHWVVAGLLGAAIAPTDPAVMFSVIGDREIGGRAGTILEGESGANDPVGIALMLGMIELATHADATFWIVVRVFCEQMAIGLAFGIAGGFAERHLLRRMALPSSGLSTIRTLALAGLVYGVATVAHGSGFLAVFVAGLIIGDVQAPFKAEIEAFQDGLATLAEIVVFLALGLTIDLSSFSAGRWAEGLAFAAFVAFVARPLAVAPLLAPTTLRRGERLFVMWGGLKGAVPILLAAFALGRHVTDAPRIYEIVFVVVLASVVVQGGTISLAARRLGIESRVRRRASHAG